MLCLHENTMTTIRYYYRDAEGGMRTKIAKVEQEVIDAIMFDRFEAIDENGQSVD